MPFSEQVKALARSRAHHRCVVCRIEPFAEVHHIVPESERGSDDIDNAAPLCAGCHDKYGNDPNKRKQIREMRDQWYAVCETRYKDPDVKIIVVNTANIIDSTMKQGNVEDARVNQEIQESLSRILSIAQNRFRVPLSHEDIVAMSGYVATASTAASATPSQMVCPSCGQTVSLGARFCHHCGTPLS